MSQIFFRGLGRSRIFSGAFGDKQFGPKKFFGALGASENPAPPGGGGGVVLVYVL